MTTETPNRPAFILYRVEGDGQNASWTKIGAAWPNRDGKGFNLKLDYLPLNGAELVLRVPDAAEAATADEATTPANEGGY